MSDSETSCFKKICSNLIPRIGLGIIFTYIYCEYLIYYVTQIQCDWPNLNDPTLEDEPVRVMMLADTHLLGSREGHWLDKWRREWQMHRAFQTAIILHQPEVVFVLGDLFDEGKWASDDEFDDYVKRFNKYFNVPDHIQRFVIAGNHDIGFHYRMIPHYVYRFETQLDSPPVSLVSIRNNHFILINSVVMEGDGCKVCARADKEIENIADIFKCTLDSPLCKQGKKLEKYTKPIVLQHYPLYRPSDSACMGEDVAPNRGHAFEERVDCLSKEMTEHLIDVFTPRAAIGAHTHHGCFLKHSFAPTQNHKIEFPEYSLASFSWRNREDPKYYLVTVSNEEVVMSSCAMPSEIAMKLTAVIMLSLLMLYAGFRTWRKMASTYYTPVPNKEA